MREGRELPSRMAANIGANRKVLVLSVARK
jgi:hypothetical protein